MIKRPLLKRFSPLVLTCVKETTIRDSAWPVGKPVMLYNWSGSPYRSPQVNVAAVMVLSAAPITIRRNPDDTMAYAFTPTGGARVLWETEGFASWADMDAHFRPLLKPGETVEKHLMRFRPL